MQSFPKEMNQVLYCCLSIQVINDIVCNGTNNFEFNITVEEVIRLLIERLEEGSEIKWRG